jgi:hypothetical protein
MITIVNTDIDRSLLGIFLPDAYSEGRSLLGQCGLLAVLKNPLCLNVDRALSRLRAILAVEVVPCLRAFG